MAMCFVTKITEVHPIDGADRIHLAIVMNEQVIVSKDWGVGKLGLFFPSDTVLSVAFLHNNNLYKNSHLNKETHKKGFFSGDGRVKYQSMRGSKSEGFFCDVSALDYIEGHTPVQDGNCFSRWDEHDICSKYVSQQTQKEIKQKKQKKKKTPSVCAAHFRTHKNTDQIKHFVHKISKGSLVSISHKVHGTSFRCAYTQVSRSSVPKIDFSPYPSSRSLRMKPYRCGGGPSYIQPSRVTKCWEVMTGSRRVLIEGNSDGYHGPNQYRLDVTEAIQPFLVKGMTVYGEIFGYVNGKPIMGSHKTSKVPDKEFKAKYGKEVVYSYGCKPYEYKFLVYRVSMTGADGAEVDYTSQQLSKWCEDSGLEAPQQLCEPFIYDGNAKVLLSKVVALAEREELLGEDYVDSTHPCEGVVVRCENGSLTPKLLKYKSSWFRLLEGQSTALDVEDAS